MFFLVLTAAPASNHPAGIDPLGPPRRDLGWMLLYPSKGKSLLTPNKVMPEDGLSLWKMD
jgi:hypothetical protein